MSRIYSLGAVVNGFLLRHTGNTARNIETGAEVPMTRKEFRKFVKDFHGEFQREPKLGEYFNVRTGKVERLWGLD
jgi:hypothetical protein